MVRIALVEDDPQEAAAIKGLIDRFSAETETETEVVHFQNPLLFLDSYRPVWQVVFMDIRMPGLNGIDAARQLRRQDERVPLVFITNMAQYAIRGYEVSAVDFILKPVSYYRFCSLMQKLLRRLAEEEGTLLTVRTPGRICRVSTRQIRYISVEDHLLIYHLEEGLLESWGTLKTVLSELPPEEFLQINKNTVVNLRKVQSIAGSRLLIGTDELPVSRSRKADVLTALSRVLR